LYKGWKKLIQQIVEKYRGEASKHQSGQEMKGVKDHLIEVLSTVSIVFLATQAGGGGFESYPHCRMIWGGIRKACERWTYKKCCVFYVILPFIMLYFLFQSIPACII